MKFSSIPCASFLLAALLCTAVHSFGQEASSESSSSSSSNGEHRNVNRWRNSTGVSDFNVESRGTIELTDDDKDVKSLSNDGYLEITKTVFGAKRSIVIESLGGGKVKTPWVSSEKVAGGRSLNVMGSKVVKWQTVNEESAI